MTRRRLISIVVGLAVLAAVLRSLTASEPATSPVRASAAAEAKDDDRRILVRFEPGTPASEKAAVHRGNGARTENVLRPERVEVVRLGKGDTVDAALRRYRRNANVEFAEPNKGVKVATTPDDPYFPGNRSLSGHDLWGLHNSGQNSGKDDADIDAPRVGTGHSAQAAPRGRPTTSRSA